MSTLLLYLLKLSLSLGVMYIFYRLVLQRFTFYRHNRWYLLLYSMVSFLIPLIDLTDLWSPSSPGMQQVKEWVPPVTQYARPAAEAAGLSTWVMGLLVAVSLFLLIRICVRLWSLRQLRSKASLLRDGQVKVYQVEEPIAPFSFGNAIYINQHQHTAGELENILRHEFVHVRERHTVDMLWAEFLCLINWYNPAAWLIRKAIRQNLEFIADNRVLATGVDKKEYQYLLLQVLGQRPVPAGISFNVSSLKKRIAMMNKNKTARAHLSWFLLLLPVASIVLLSFRSNWPPAKTTIAIAPAWPLTDTVPKVKEVRVQEKAFKKPAAKKSAKEPVVKEVRFKAPKTQPAKTETIEIVPVKEKTTTLQLAPVEKKKETLEITPVREKKVPAEKMKTRERKVQEIEIIETPVKKSKAAKLPTEQQWEKAAADKKEKRVVAADKQMKQVYTGNVAYTNGRVTLMSDSVVITKTGDAKNGTYQMRADHIRVIPVEHTSKDAPAPAPKLK
ncbi:M56 family metallopeptidase [Terrimonas ferruginea]|uniref:M56 family metallopeptidase n=1 Tax=Terrimonas ferruginea TaxID=249 RepID=UPI00041829AF|nr:M56 family metallopeptidase [Terrimonas ferruginea]